MLRHIKIENYALIERSDIDFGDGFVAITGETGAGKTILLGALGLLLGQRADVQTLRDAQRKCIVEATFRVAGLGLESFFEANDLDYDDELLLRRELLPGGKSRAFVNDTPVPLTVLKALAPKIVDIHSQHETLTLADSDFQFSLLDARCSSLPAYKEAYSRYSALKRRMEQLTAADAQARRDADYLQFQYNELAQARLQADEQQQLEQEAQLLDHAESVKEGLSTIGQNLTADEHGALSRLVTAHAAMSRIKPYHPDFEELERRINSVRIELADIADTLEHLDGSIQYDPERQQQVADRLDMIYRLERKHGVDSVDALLAIEADLDARLQQAASLDSEIRAAMEEVDKAFGEVQRHAKALGRQRREAAKWLEGEVQPLLADMGMPHARLQVSLAEAHEYNAHGNDKVSFLFSANKGGEPRELGKVASGGELSRLMLAVKCLYAGLVRDGGGVPACGTFIFDEIDSGISGSVSVKVAALMERMASGVQVVAITHLPQIAARAAQHLRVYKTTDSEGGTRTTSHIKQLDDAGRLHEIAVMLSSEPPTKAALQTAKELMETRTNCFEFVV